ncbi:MFS transporter [Kitasatospora sp. NPDC058201]|uniref:MFS transporter n=1 Tax=Streptomycetaceae TaxID=2062 RepID=UPI002E79486C|nr:MFS transporter [Streptomyces sp. BE303]MED7955243.1 MFS transporter [Streptomyces sp. BE303]
MTTHAPPSLQPSRSRWLALGVLCTGNLMIILDGSIVTVALPTIQNDLGFTQSGLAWVVNAYLIAFAGLLLLSGRLGDLLGGKRVFAWGLGLFTAASLACGLASTSTALVVFRFVQGVGGALASAVVLGMIITLFPDAGERGKALAAYAFVSAAGASLGLILGGVLTQSFSWPWVFYVNVPIGLAALVLTQRVVPGAKGLGLREGADLIGSVLATGGLMLLVYTIIKAEEYTWGDIRTLGLLAGSLALLAGFVVRQAYADKPLLPLHIFRSRSVSGANTIMVLMVAGLFGYQFCTALYFQNVLGYDALKTGLAFLPAPVTIAVVSLGFAVKLNQRFGPRQVLVGGLLLVAAALALLARVPSDGTFLIDIVPPFVLLGLGFGAAMPALIGQAMSVNSPNDAGIASGLVNTTQQVGASIGTAVLATVAASRTATLLGEQRSPAEALTGGFHLSYGLSAVFVGIAVLVAAFVLRSPASEPAPAAAEGAEDAPGPDLKSADSPVPQI